MVLTPLNPILSIVKTNNNTELKNTTQNQTNILSNLPQVQAQLKDIMSSPPLAPLHVIELPPPPILPQAEQINNQNENKNDSAFENKEYSQISKENIDNVMNFINEIKEKYTLKRRPQIRFNELSSEEKNELIKIDPRYGKIICRCEKITEAEIVDAIHRLCGATTIKGVKKRVRPGMGKCQGGFCSPLVLNILARELNKSPLDITYDSENSNILNSISKGEGHE